MFQARSETDWRAEIKQFSKLNQGNWRFLKSATTVSNQSCEQVAVEGGQYSNVLSLHFSIAAGNRKMTSCPVHKMFYKNMNHLLEIIIRHLSYGSQLIKARSNN